MAPAGALTGIDQLAAELFATSGGDFSGDTVGDRAVPNTRVRSPPPIDVTTVSDWVVANRPLVSIFNTFNNSLFCSGKGGSFTFLYLRKYP
jgi:hypothetical protein